MTDTQKLVMYGYGDLYDLQTRSLNFTTEHLRVEEAAEIVKLVPEYNEFDGEKTAAIILDVAELWPAPVTFSFGREYSPVLYINFPYFDNTRNRIENREELVGKSARILEAVRPDELTREQSGLRVWWD